VNRAILPGPDPAQVAGLSNRDRILIWGCVAAITALAWGYLLFLDRQMAPAMEQDTMMAGMSMAMERPWAARDLFFAFLMWLVMMVGMMTGPAAPLMLLFAHAQARRSQRRVPLIVLVFGLGYVAVWAGFSACAALAQWALHQAAMLSPALSTSSSYLSGAILCLAGVYQMTPFKRTCLMHCQSPLGFLLTHWRDGIRGALQMGALHGAYCLGCCWALMGVLFVVGVMNLLWVAALTLFVLLEKVGPTGVVVSRVAGAAMIAVGALYFVGIL
jgi:predicted metal-binding membrane protein